MSALFILVNLTIWPQAYAAGSCLSVDLRTTFPDSPRDQGDISWCYAHTAADQLKFNLKTPTLSATHLALNYNRTWVALTMRNIVKFFQLFKKNKNRLGEHQTGFLKLAIKQALRKGVCPQSVIDDSWIKRMDLFSGESSQVPLRTAITDINGSIKTRFKQGNIDLEDIGYYYQWGNLSKQDFESIVRKHRPGKILYNLAKTSCKNDLIEFSKKFARKTKVIQIPKPFRVMAAIDAQLDRGNLVSIDYISGFLRHKEHRKAWSPDTLHTSSIVARRHSATTGRCEYLVRNSHGENCERYLDKFSCEKGNVWVDEKSLRKHILLITYLKLPHDFDNTKW